MWRLTLAAMLLCPGVDAADKPLVRARRVSDTVAGDISATGEFKQVRRAIETKVVPSFMYVSKKPGYISCDNGHADCEGNAKYKCREECDTKKGWEEWVPPVGDEEATCPIRCGGERKCCMKKFDVCCHNTKEKCHAEKLVDGEVKCPTGMTHDPNGCQKDGANKCSSGEKFQVRGRKCNNRKKEFHPEGCGHPLQKECLELCGLKRGAKCGRRNRHKCRCCEVEPTPKVCCVKQITGCLDACNRRGWERAPDSEEEEEEEEEEEDQEHEDEDED